MSRRQRPITPENPEDHRDDVLPGTIYQTVSYDADDEKSSGSSLPTRTQPAALLHPSPRKKNVVKKKKLVKPAEAVVVDEVDQLVVDTSAPLVSNNKKTVL